MARLVNGVEDGMESAVSRFTITCHACGMTNGVIAVGVDDASLVCCSFCGEELGTLGRLYQKAEEKRLRNTPSRVIG